MESSSIIYSIVIIILIAVLTFGARLFPYLAFSRGGETPKVITYLGNVLPPAVMAMLIIYCLKNISLIKAPFGSPELVSILVVMVLYKITKNNLLAMVGGTILYMVLIQYFFV
ncbi:branched-chain amino acid transporter permease [Anaerovorax odorimutans]|uniref:branched-chain amino acid transporter permease n=1 Tax=Anaerovorax odorimutans TaxID=109327 RepID=UPI0003FA9BB1|nr:AzlD domain-containing protein [Anaerovorax odorimutans]